VSGVARERAQAHIVRLQRGRAAHTGRCAKFMSWAELDWLRKAKLWHHSRLARSCGVHRPVRGAPPQRCTEPCRHATQRYNSPWGIAAFPPRFTPSSLLPPLLDRPAVGQCAWQRKLDAPRLPSGDRGTGALCRLLAAGTVCPATRGFSPRCLVLWRGPSRQDGLPDWLLPLLSCEQVALQGTEAYPKDKAPRHFAYP
jgi:hypothetical protein